MFRKLALPLMLLAASPAFAAIEVETVRVGHGISAWYAASPTVPVVDVEISFEGAGFAGDPAGKEGRAALTASMLTEGAGQYDALAFSQALEDGAIELSASTEADRMTIHLRVLREQAIRGAELLALALKEPRFAEEDLARVKAEFQSQLSQLDESPAYRAGRKLAAKAFPNHPYANPPYGTKPSVAALSASDLRNFLATYATRSHMRVAVAGDVDAELIRDMLEPVVETLSDEDATDNVVPVTLQSGGELLKETMPVPQTVVLFAAPGVARSDPRFYAASILNYALGGDGLIARLARTVRQDKGLAYYVGTSLDTKRGTALISGQLATRNASAADAIAAVKATLADVKARGLTHQECEDARTYVLNSQMLRLDSSDDVANTLLAMQIYDLGEDYLSKREGYLKSVRCEDVNKLAAELLDPSRFLFSQAGGDVP